VEVDKKKKPHGEGAWSSQGMAIENDPLLEDDMNDLADKAMSPEWLKMEEEMKEQIENADEGPTK